MPASPAEQIAGLERLCGQDADPKLRRNLAMVYMIGRCQSQGITWNQIARAIGAENGKAAKAYAKRLAKGCQSQLLAELVGQ